MLSPTCTAVRDTSHLRGSHAWLRCIFETYASWKEYAQAQRLSPRDNRRDDKLLQPVPWIFSMLVSIFMFQSKAAQCFARASTGLYRGLLFRLR